MIPDPHPDLAGRNLVLRKFEAGQVHDRYIAWLNDPKVNSHSQRLGGATIGPQEACRYLDGLAPDEVVLGIHHHDQGHVGNVKYGPVDWANSRADVSILIGEPNVWGKSVGAEAVYLVSRFLFEELGLNRVDAGSNNPAYLRLVENLGWQVEGVLRQRVRTDTGFTDHTLVAMLSGEFKRQQNYEAIGARR